MDTLDIVITVIAVTLFGILTVSCISNPTLTREDLMRRRLMMMNTNRIILPINNGEEMFQTREQAIQDWKNEQDETKVPEIVITLL